MNSKKLPSLSLFFPAFNEEANIAVAITSALKVLPKVARVYEIIVVNDGSTDATKSTAQALAKKHPAVRVVTQKNKGYGGALKLGFSKARYEWIFFTDADLQFDLSELTLITQEALSKDLQLVLGYRLSRAEGWKRQLFASALKIWNQVLLGFPSHIKDIDCAFKLIKREVIKTVEPLFSDGAMISTELLLKAHRAGFSYKQVGVHHYPRQAGSPSGNNLSVIIKAVVDTFRLKLSLVGQKQINPQLSKIRVYLHSLTPPLI